MMILNFSKNCNRLKQSNQSISKKKKRTINPKLKRLEYNIETHNTYTRTNNQRLTNSTGTHFKQTARQFDQTGKTTKRK